MRIEGSEPVAMQRVPRTGYWAHLAQLGTGMTHNFSVLANGEPLGLQGSPVVSSVAGFNPLSYPLPDVPSGALSERRTVKSAIYGGAESDYWVYTNPGVDVKHEAPVMVWLDGAGLVGVEDALGLRMQTVTDNLVHRGEIPPMVHVLLSPARGGTRQPPDTKDIPAPAAMRSLQYDEVTEEFGRHLLEEVLPEVGRTVKLRRDGYSRAIAGASSGGVCAFKVGWFAPGQFSRVHAGIGSFVALGWKPERGIEGGHIFPTWIRRNPRRNLRVWLSGGVNDFDVDSSVTLLDLHRGGSWPLANLQMAQALKTTGYDFHFRYGNAGHNLAQLALDLPESLAWLWRDYDPNCTEQSYEQDAEEKAKPVYRVGVLNREAW